MPIIEFTKGNKIPYDTLLYKGPDQLVSEKTKQSDTWIKENMDYYWTIAVSQYTKNKEVLKRNYELVKGILRRSDFYDEQPKEIKEFADILLENEDLPAYVKHYSILTPPINTMIGEMAKRPDNIYVKAFDENSQSEELQFKTEILNQYIINNARIRLQSLLAMKGIELESPEELEQITLEQVEDELTNYTSIAEKWGSRVLEFLKVRLALKEKSEEAFRDMLISARQFYHIYEDNSPLGFNVEVLNPIGTWFQTTPDQKYTSDPLDKGVGAFAAGTIEVMELSEVIHKFNLTEKEIKHLRDYSQRDFLLNPRDSNLVNPTPGERGIEYDTYDPLIYEQRLAAEAALLDSDYSDFDILGTGNTVGTFGYKYTVLRAYWCSKKKIGKLTYIDIDGIEQTEFVDENYKEGSHPGEIDIEWEWINQWYQGVKIGHDVYYVKPLELFDYCPIIGCIFENKNTKSASLVDLMKPYQILYNVSMNQLFRLLEKDMGVVFLTSLRTIPVPKDGDYQDAVQIWEDEAREKGIIFTDDSPENLRGGPSSFNQYSAINLSRAQEIQIRYQLAIELRNECWKLVGLTEQRLGSVTSSETATGTNAALSQSYAQTEPWFTQHENTINKLYQAILDAAMYIESKKPTSTISYITGEGTHAFVQVNGSDLALKDLGVLITSRQEDADNLRQLRMLGQAMLQNGAHPYEISVIFNSKSSRFIQDTLKKLKDKQDEYQQQIQEIEQAKIQQAEEQFAKQQQLLQIQQEKEQAFQAFQAEQERLSKEKIAYIQAASKNQQSADLGSFEREEAKIQNDYNLQLQTLSQKQQDILARQAIDQQKLQLEDKKLQMEKYKIDKQEQIEKIKLRNKVSGEK